LRSSVDKYTLHCVCEDCGHSYALQPTVPYPIGGGVYSSSKDWCPKCGGFPNPKFGCEAHRPKKLRVCDAALLVLEETGNPAVMWGDRVLLHQIANRAGLKRRKQAWQTENAVLSALSRQPGKLVPGYTRSGGSERRLRIFRLSAK
jgi:hypothetical protein